MKLPKPSRQPGQVVAFDLGIKTLAVGVNEQGRFYHIGGFKGTSVVQQAAGQDPLQAGPLPEEIPPVYPPLAGLSACLRTEA